MGVHRIYYLIVARLFKCICNLGPRAVNMLQAPLYLYPALCKLRIIRNCETHQLDFLAFLSTLPTLHCFSHYCYASL